MGAACATFYRIRGGGKRPGLIDNIMEQLDSHPLSVAFDYLLRLLRIATGEITVDWRWSGSSSERVCF